MTFCEIDEQCFPVQGRDYCFHYAKQLKYDNPNLVSFRHINGKPVYYEGDPVNPWNIVADSPFENDIRAARPEKTEQPVFANRNLVQTWIKDREGAEENISSIACSDYWGAYIRNADTLETVEMIYDINVEDNRDQNDRTDGRSQLVDDAANFLDKMKDNEELVLVGNQGIFETYVRKVDNHYIFVLIQKPR